ncbi:unnamed protein product, partial [Discosporangium mesarthrocarpum]
MASSNFTGAYSSPNINQSRGRGGIQGSGAASAPPQNTGVPTGARSTPRLPEKHGSGSSSSWVSPGKSLRVGGGGIALRVQGARSFLGDAQNVSSSSSSSISSGSGNGGSGSWVGRGDPEPSSSSSSSGARTRPGAGDAAVWAAAAPPLRRQKVPRGEPLCCKKLTQLPLCEVAIVRGGIITLCGGGLLKYWVRPEAPPPLPPLLDPFVNQSIINADTPSGSAGDAGGSMVDGGGSGTASSSQAGSREGLEGREHTVEEAVPSASSCYSSA